MRQETTSSTLTAAQSRQVLRAIATAVHRTMQHPAPTNLPPYPDAIPEIEDHIERLVRAVRESEPEARAAAIVKHSCPACPHQFPSRYCPLRPHGGCVLYRCADPIAEAIASVLDDLEREGSIPQPAGACDG